MDSIKSKMMSLSQATIEATARAEIFEQEQRRVQEIADKYEEQVSLNLEELKKPSQHQESKLLI